MNKSFVKPRTDKDEPSKNDVDATEATKSKSSKKKADKNHSQVFILLIPTLVIFFGVLIIFTVVHYSTIRYRVDPLAGIAEFTRVTAANTDVEKAHAHLSLAEAKLRDFIALRTNSPNDQSSLSAVASVMVANDKKAMQYMDKAKKAGVDIRKLNLVERLCDSLGLQSSELAHANTELNHMHDFARLLRVKTDGGEDLNRAYAEVEASLSAAMSW